MVAIAAGTDHGLALASNGAVWAWGYNAYGQLGDGTTNTTATPVQAMGLPPGIVAIAGGYLHSLALASDGTVWAWGYNAFGQLGDGTLTNRSTPVQVSGLSGVVAIAASSYATSLALKSDGTVWAWGYNGDGELGNGTTTNSSTPIQVTGLTGVVGITAGSYHVVAVKSDGTVWGWGYGGFGQLANGTSSNTTTPVQAVGPGGTGVLSGIVAVAAGGYSTLALRSDGTAWSWGRNESGELGNGSTTNSPTPVQVVGPSGSGYLSGVAAIAQGASFGLALTSDGAVFGWGYNYNSELGSSSTTTGTTIPIRTSNVSGVVAIAAGGNNGLALQSQASAETWGDNFYGELGNGTNVNSLSPVAATTVSRLAAIGGGTQFSLALRSDGTLWAWGYNGDGELGNGTTTDSNMPVQVSGLSGVVASSPGYFHSLALKSDGTVWAWGDNSAGELGNGTTTNSTTPVQVSGLSGVVAVAAGDNFSLALKSDGTVWAWGANAGGQLGNNSTSNSSTPVQVVDVGGTNFLSGVMAIAAGDSHSVALKTDGTVWAWGSNANGELGNGATTNSSTPVQVVGTGGSGFLTGVSAIAAGSASLHTLALKPDGSVWAWGYGGSGQLGNGGFASSSTPVQVLGVTGGPFTGVATIAAGFDHSLAIKGDGTAWAWGDDTHGQLGNGATTNSASPVPILGVGGAGNLVAAAIAGGFYHSVSLAVPASTTNLLAGFAVSPSTTAPLPGVPVDVTVTAKTLRVIPSPTMSEPFSSAAATSARSCPPTTPLRQVTTAAIRLVVA